MPPANSTDTGGSGWSPLNLPVLLLAVPGGVLGDLLNRKKLIVADQAVMLASAAALGALDVAGLVTPAVLLILLCGVGVGQGLTGPIAQTLQPELVPAPERTQAIALGSLNQNLARAIGRRSAVCCSPLPAPRSCSSSTRPRSWR